MRTDFDIIVIGGGMVGAATAAALGRSPLRVGLVEPDPPPPLERPAEYAQRVSAINLATERLLQALDVWPTVAGQRIGPYRHMHVWDSEGGGAIDFDAADVGGSHLGHIVENPLLRGALWMRLGDNPQIEVLAPAEPAGIEWGAVPTVVLSNGERLRTRLVVGADGARSQVRAWAGVDTRGWRYDQHAVVATVRTERPHEETAWQRFLPSGPLAFLPLADGRCSIVWSTAPEHAQALCDMDEDAFTDTLTEAFEYRLGRVEATGQRASFPLALAHAEHYVRPGMALVGDAAHSVHPLAGQGANLGFMDAATLAEVVADAYEAGRDPGTLHTLRRYERWRKGQNLAMMAALDGFKRLFGASAAPVRWLRGVGLNLTDAAGPLKRRIVAHAAGVAGDLPRLALRPVASDE